MEASDDEEWESISTQPATAAGAPLATRTSTATESATISSTTETNEHIDGSDQSDEISSLILAAPSLSRRTAPQATDNQSRILAVSTKLEGRRQMKDKLMHHPIHVLWSRFLGYLLNEVWHVDLRIRLALVMIFLGFITKCIVFSTALLWNPRLFLIPALILVPFFYLNPSYIPVTLDRAMFTLQNPAKLAECLGDFNSAALRRVVLGSLFIPTMLEVRAIQFLSQIQVEATWGIVYHLSVAGLIAAAMVVAYTRYDKAPRECSHIGLVCLYGSALFVATILQFDIWKIPLLVAPFFLATGILLLHSVDDNYEWCTRAIRHALRLSLRDALASVSESVSQDEMLQLAMLRWLVDYWGSTTTTTASASTAGQAATATSAQTSRVPPSSGSSVLVPIPAERELTWGELLPMLTLTSEQIRTEVDVLRQDEASSILPIDESMVVRNDAMPERPTSSRPASSPSTGSVNDFQTMLASMDLDEHAKPAVMAYKKAVQHFPPSRETAILLSVARRCPALLALLWELLFADSGKFLATLTLVPFVVFELLRCKSWCESCKQAASPPDANSSTEHAGGEALFLESVDPMVILLSGDKLSLHRPPTMLGVWMNVVSSVAALEMGLTAVRCVQTTTAAIDFAQNIMSLAEFGYQVASYGWMHGAGVLAKELIIHHMRPVRDESSIRETRYTSAALRAVENSRRVSQNVRILMEDENSGQLLPPIVGLLSTAVGRGWLWGRDDVMPQNRPHSTVIIEELDSTESNVVDDSNEADVTARMDLTDSDVVDVLNKANVTARMEDDKDIEDNFRVAEVMDLIAAASSRHLIDQEEKDNLCEQLSSFKSYETADKGWLEATHRTLQGLILIDDRAEDAVEDIGGQFVPTIHETSNDQERKNIDDTNLVDASPETSAPDRAIVAVVLDATDRQNLEPVSFEADQSRENVTFAEQEPSADSMTELHRVHVEEFQSNGDNVWRHLGGGLAVVGAVVGMAAIALQSNSSNEDRRSRARDRQNDHQQPSQ